MIDRARTQKGRLTNRAESDRLRIFSPARRAPAVVEAWALQSLRPASGVNLARARSDTALSVTRAGESFIGSTAAKRENEQQLKASVQAAIAAEKVYLGAVRAFLRRTPSRSQQRNFWRISENLRNRLDDLSASVPAIAAKSVRGANVLSQWFRRLEHATS